MNKKIVLPHYLREGIKPLKRGFPRYIKVFACDVETNKGKPYLLILYDGKEINFVKVTPENIEMFFAKYLSKKCTSKGYSNRVFFHNLQFDITAIFNQNEHMFEYLSPPVFETYDEEGNLIAKTEIKAQKVWYGTTTVNKGVRVKLVDSANFILGSLYNISRTLKLKHKKGERPKFVNEGRKPRNEKEWKELYKYCTQEILSEYELGKYIIGMHEKYDVPFCISSSQFSERVFKKHFLKEPIPQCPPYVRRLAELNYHGGRASYFEKGIRVIPNVKLYDYNSFYPWALYNLPRLTKGEWKPVHRFVDKHEGFYIVNGHVKKCKYPIILKDSKTFDYAKGERISKVVVSSYELREALRTNEIRLRKIKGYVWIPDEEAMNPFKDYVEEFYEKKKNTKKDNPMYITFKLLLNQLYGKTIQTNRKTEYNETPDYELVNGRLIKPEIEWEAGGLYLPHVGAWTTSICRAELHKALHDYEAIACATDSFITTKEAKTGEGLGELKLECEGLLLSIRPKLYVIFSKEVQKEVEKVGDLRKYLKKNLDTLQVGNDIVKYATHGFWGKVTDLLRLYVECKTKHEVLHMTKIRESLKQKKQPRVMEKQKRTLKVDWKEEIGFCGMKKIEAVTLTTFTLVSNHLSETMSKPFLLIQ